MYAIILDGTPLTANTEKRAIEVLALLITARVKLDLEIGDLYLEGNIRRGDHEDTFEVVTDSGVHSIILRADGVISAMPGIPHAYYKALVKKPRTRKTKGKGAT